MIFGCYIDKYLTTKIGNANARMKYAGIGISGRKVSVFRKHYLASPAYQQNILYIFGTLAFSSF